MESGGTVVPDQCHDQHEQPVEDAILEEDPVEVLVARSSILAGHQREEVEQGEEDVHDHAGEEDQLEEHGCVRHLVIGAMRHQSGAFVNRLLGGFGGKRAVVRSDVTTILVSCFGRWRQIIFS